eukprot:jgi/Undpi1/7114/HiC_scaffold_22.g09588.m1
MATIVSAPTAPDGDLFSFIRQFVDKRTRVILEIIKHATTQWMTWSAGVMNAVNEFWQQSQASSGPPENVVEGLPSRVREDRVIVFNDKEEASTKEEETKEVEEDDEVAKEVFVPIPKSSKDKKAHNGVRRSSKKKGAKSRAAYSLRGVSGDVQ